jgi:hypothetical protein
LRLANAAARHGNLEVRCTVALAAVSSGSRAASPAAASARVVADSLLPVRRAGADAVVAPRSADEDRVFEDALAEFDGQGDARWTKARPPQPV